MKSVKELVVMLTTLFSETKNTYTEKDLAIFRHVNTIDMTAKNANTNLEEIKASVYKIKDCIS